MTDNDLNDYEPDISDGWVVWYASDGQDGEIYLWDGESVQKLTDDTNNDQRPRTDGRYVAWQGQDGNDFEIFIRK